MDAGAGRSVRAWMVSALVVVLLALSLGGQAIADQVEPTSGGASTAEVVSQAGFSYLTGLRTYAAAVLWNRIEPILHGYYQGEGLKGQRYMLPTLSAVVMLDPQFEDAYYVGAWIVASNDEVESGIELARQGVEANPNSGRLRVGYAQMLETWGEDLEAAHEQAALAMSPDMEWRDGFEKHDSYAIIGAIMKLSEDAERAALVHAEIERLDLELGDSLPAGSHDHDGDGVPDH